MAHFLGLCHGNCGLRYVGGILHPKKLGFRGFKGQFDVKKANFRGLTAKIGCLRPILKFRPMTNFHGLRNGNCALCYIEGILEPIKLDFRSLKCQFDVKRPILGD